MHNHHFYIAVEGPIGVGKTTLSRILREELGGHSLLEVFEENPFLSDFYQDRARYAFQTQIFFLLSRYRQQYDVVSALLATVWGDSYFGDDKIVDVNVRRLRMKIEPEPSNPKYLTTVWGFGYKWVE